MLPWERRLKDLSVIFEYCHNNYFSPELFQLNINQFLQISRTITFIIQKNKDDLPNYSSWYTELINRWKDDKIMVWAKDSRNIIEKVGDLDLYSSINLSLIFSYLEENDFSIEIEKRNIYFKQLKEYIKK